MNQKTKELLTYIELETSKKSFRLKLSKSKQVNAGGLRSSGYFNEKDKVLAVATAKPTKWWVATLIHEFCHFQQWSENSKIWVNYTETLRRTSYMSLLEKKKVFTNMEMESIKENLYRTALLELDCEMRTVKIIKEFGLDKLISIDEYIQKSIAYVLFYNTMLDTRSWYKRGKEPYTVARAWKSMPKTFDGLNVRDPKLTRIIKEACF